MSTKMKVCIAAIALVVIGALGIVLGDTKGPEPELICAKPGEQASGMISASKNCNTTQQSMNAWDEWNHSAQPIKAAGVIAIAVGLLVAIGVGITALVQRSTKKKSNDHVDKA